MYSSFPTSLRGGADIRPVSDKYREVITGGHTVAQKVELLLGGEVVMDLTDRGVVVDGNVNASSRNAVQRSGSCVLADREGALIPGETAGASKQLAPAGAELRLWRGIAYHDTTPELVPVGTMRFITNRVEAPRMSLELYDRAWAISQAKTVGVVTITAGTSVVAAIRLLLSRAWGPGLEMNFPDTDEVTNNMAFEPDSDPWEICQQLAANIGMRLFFDPMGTAVMAPEPDPLTDPVVWEFLEGNPKNMLLPGASVNWEGTAPNLVTVVGENSDNDTVYTGTAIDLDANSLTRYGGPYGRIHRLLRDEKVASKVQATFRARSELNRGLGLIMQPSLPILPNPAFEPGDIFLTVSPRYKLGQWSILDEFTLPLRASGSMTITCRERHITELSVA
jgi:hypothetical protein